MSDWAEAFVAAAAVICLVIAGTYFIAWCYQ
jgi:hypothetical protein